jgi:hypothetical protein
LAVKVLLIAACHLIIAPTQELLQTKQSFTSQMNRAEKISYALSPPHPYRLQVQTTLYKKWLQAFFFIKE